MEHRGATNAPAASPRPMYAAWSTLADPLVAEAVATSGVDAVVVDLQHGHAGWDALPGLVRAIRRGGATAIVPMIESAEQAGAAARACRYPPAGERSWGRLLLPGDAGAALSAADVNSQVTCLVMIETRAGVEALEDILTIEGVDGVFIGPFDLSLTHGYGGRGYRDCAELEALIAHIVQRCAAHGKESGLFCTDPAMARDWIARGVGLVTVGMDLRLLWTAYRASVADIRGAAGG
ncbi:MAG: hypothetical protein IPI32_11675 [Austwickia sp.]|nr:hypothetical protein [Austwickia sp.]MBK8435859.1 hypothetical protein [Austwickia sp.]MBK9101544.1 hypothetical protein [Austwickia sp.]